MDTVALNKALDWGLLKSLSGKSFCFTGTMSVKRDDLTKLINILGGHVQTSVTKTTDYLIVPAEEFRKGSKYQAALKWGTAVLNEEDFCDLILPTLDELLVSN